MTTSTRLERLLERLLEKQRKELAKPQPDEDTLDELCEGIYEIESEMQSGT